MIEFKTGKLSRFERASVRPGSHRMWGLRGSKVEAGKIEEDWVGAGMGEGAESEQGVEVKWESGSGREWDEGSKEEEAASGEWDSGREGLGAEEGVFGGESSEVEGKVEGVGSGLDKGLEGEIESVREETKGGLAVICNCG